MVRVHMSIYVDGALGLRWHHGAVAVGVRDHVEPEWLGVQDREHD